MADNYQQVISLAFDVLGAADAQKVADVLQGVGTAGDKTNEQLGPLIDKFEALAQQSDLVKQALDLSSKLAANEAALAKAKQSLADLNAEFDRTDKSSAEITIAFQQAQKSVTSLTNEQLKLQNASAAMGEKLAAAGINTNDLGTASADLKSKTEGAAAELVNLAEQAEATRLQHESLKASTEQLGESIKTGGEKAVEFGKRLLEITGISAAVATALAALTGEKIFGDGLKDAAAFQESITKAGLATNATAEELEKLGDAAEKAAETTHSSGDEAAAALAILARGAGGAQNAIAELVPTLLLSKAAQIDSASAADILGTAIAEFGLQASDAGSVTDLLAKTATVAKVNLSDLSEGFAKVAPDAKAAGVSINQTAAFFGALSNNGIRGRKATEDLSTVFQEFANPTSKLNEDLLGLGLSGLSLVQVLQKLSTNSAGTARIVQDMGNKGGSAFRALINSVPGLTQVSSEVNNNAGAAQNAADKYGNDLTGAFKRFTTAFGNAAHALTEPLLDPLAEQFNKAGAAITEFTKTANFAKIRDAVLDFVTGAVDGFKNFAKSLGDSSDTTSTKIADFVRSAGSAFKSFSETLGVVGRVATGIGDTFGVVFNAAKGAIGTLVAVTVNGVAYAVKAYEALRVILGGTQTEIDAIDRTFQNLLQTGSQIAADSQKSFSAAGQNLVGIGNAVTGTGNAIADAGTQTESFTMRILRAAAAAGKQKEATEAVTAATIPGVTALHAMSQEEIDAAKAHDVIAAAAGDAAAQQRVLKESFSALKISSQGDLNFAAQTAETAFKNIDAYSKNTAEGLADRQTTFIAYAKAALNAAAGLGTLALQQKEYALQSTADRLGLSVSFDQIKKSAEASSLAVQNSSKDVVVALAQEGAAADSMAAKFEAAMAVLNDVNAGGAEKAKAAADAVANAANDNQRQIAEIAKSSLNDFQQGEDHIKSFTTSFSGLSQAAIDAYQNAQKAAITLVTGMTAFAAQYAQIQDEANRRTNASILDQQNGVKNLTDLYNGFAASANNADGQTAAELQRRADAMQRFSDQLKAGTSDFNYLDQSSLSALEASVDAAKAKVQQLADAALAAQKQFADLAQQTQDALDQANGNQTAIEVRRHATALQNLKDEATAAGQLNSQVYQQAVANENALYNLNIANLKKQADAQKASNSSSGGSSGGSASSPTVSNNKPNSNVGSGGAAAGIPANLQPINIFVDSAHHATVFGDDPNANLIAELMRAKRNSI